MLKFHEKYFDLLYDSPLSISSWWCYGYPKGDKKCDCDCENLGFAWWK